MPLFMDVHTMDAIDPDALAGAHERDLEVQGNHGVNFLKYWYSEDTGKVWCLADAPTKDAMNAVHRDAHGLVADEIVPVKEGS
jgi:hypothetical protein